MKYIFKKIPKSLLLIWALSFSFLGNAQNKSFEFAKIAGDGNPTATGKVQTTAINFVLNTNNPTGNAFTTTTSPLTATFTLSAQQFPLSGVAPAVSFGYLPDSTTGGPVNIFSLMSDAGSPQVSYYTSTASTAGTGIDPTQNRAVQLALQTAPLRGQPINGKYRMADLTITFNRPVTNPILHFTGLGGTFREGGVESNPKLGYAGEFDYISSNVPVTFSKLSGTTAFKITNTQIQNSASTITASGPSSGSGSVLLSGIGITTITLRVSIRGDGKGTVWSDSSTQINGDVMSIGVSAAPDLSDLAITKTVNNSSPVVGTNVIFTLIAKNNGPGNNTNVKITDVIPAGYTYLSNDSGATYNAGTLTWDVGALADGASKTLKFTAKVLATGPYNNSATINTISGLADPVPANNLATVVVNASSTCIPPSITAQPTISQTVGQNTTSTTLSVVATGTALTYQWYNNATNINSGGTLITGATESTYTPPTTALGTTYYYVIISGQCIPTKISTTSTLKVEGDIDNDGIPNSLDLDNDNDGILDSVECPPVNAVINGTFDTDLSGWTVNPIGGVLDTWIQNTGTARIEANSKSGVTLSQSLNNLDKAQNGAVSLSLTIGAQDGNNAAGSTASLQILLNGTVYATVSNGILKDNSNVTISYANGATGNFATFGTIASGYTSQNFMLSLPYSGPASAVLAFRATTALDDWRIDNISVPLLICKDTDGDGIPDYLDADSDNDGCPDSNEYYNTNSLTWDPANVTVDADGKVIGAGYNGSSYPNVIIATNTSITSPSNQSINIGDNATFTVGATSSNSTSFVSGNPTYGTPGNNNTNLIYQWQLSTDNGANWWNVSNGDVYSGATSTTLTITGATAAQGNNRYRAIVTVSNNICTRLESAAAILTLGSTACYNDPQLAGTPAPTNHGITLLQKAGTNNGGWPMTRNGGHTALESNTKGFVITRVTDPSLSIANPVDGMMVYDTTDKCLKIYTVDETTPANSDWKCFQTPACP